MAEAPTNPLLCDQCDKKLGYVDINSDITGTFFYCSEKCMFEGRAENVKKKVSSGQSPRIET